MPPRRQRAAVDISSNNEVGVAATTRNLPSTQESSVETPSSTNVPAKKRTSAKNTTTQPQSDGTTAKAATKKKPSKPPTKKSHTNQHDDAQDPGNNPSIDANTADAVEIQASSPTKGRKKRSADHDLPQNADGTVILPPPPTKRLKLAPPPSPSATPSAAATAATGTKKPRPRPKPKPKPVAAKSSRGGGSATKDATVTPALQHAAVIGKRKDRLSDVVEDEESESEDEFNPQAEKPKDGFIAGLASPDTANGGDGERFSGFESSDEGGEHIPGLAGLEGSDSDSEVVDSDIELGASPVKRSDNAAAAEIEMLKAKIKLLESAAQSGATLGVDAGRSSKGKSRQKANEKSVKSKKPKLPAASGLIAGWNAGNDDSDDDIETTTPVQARKPQQRSVQVVDDGLEMATDAEPEELQEKETLVRKKGRTAPSPAKTTGQVAGRKPVRDQTRRNELVSVSDVPAIPIRASADSSRSTSRAASSKPPSRSKANTIRPASSTNFVQGSSKLQAGPIVPITLPATKTGLKLNTHTVKIEHLPNFARHDNKWRNHYVPSLYAHYFRSKTPFAGIETSNKAFVAMCRSIVDDVYPDSDYVFAPSELGEPFVLLSYCRIMDKRGFIAQKTAHVIEQHLHQLDSTEDRRNWLKWALRLHDGPVFFQYPSSAELREGDKGYKSPGGRLLSPFIVGVGKYFLNLEAGKLSTPDEYPIGLFALIMTGFERALRLQSTAYQKAKAPTDDDESDTSKPAKHSGDRKSGKGLKKGSEFSADAWGAKVEQYVKALEIVEESRWTELLQACGIGKEMTGDDSFSGDISHIDVTRGYLFLSGSPRKDT